MCVQLLCLPDSADATPTQPNLLCFVQVINKSMAGIVKSLDSALKANNLEKVASTMDAVGWLVIFCWWLCLCRWGMPRVWGGALAVDKVASTMDAVGTGSPDVVESGCALQTARDASWQRRTLRINTCAVWQDHCCVAVTKQGLHCLPPLPPPPLRRSLSASLST